MMAGALLVGLRVSPSAFGEAARGRLTIRVIDADIGQPIAARMHLRDARGKAVQPPKTIFWHDHFVIDGSMTLSLPSGAYQFELERGPEYKTVSGNFEIQGRADDQKQIEMHRFVRMAERGWWSGDVHVHRKLEDIQALMRAEDLHVAPVITWWNALGRNKAAATVDKGVISFDKDRFYHTLAGEDERDGGALLYFNLARPLDLKQATRQAPPSMKFLRQAHEAPGVHVDAEKPFWWDVPLWLASGLVDSIELANNHMLRGGALDNEAWGRPRDLVRYPGPQGNGRWSETIYHHALQCGLRLAPSAGSASGVLPNPLGYNRVYVYCGSQLTYEAWWENLRAGRVFVTNGPLLIPTVDDKLPGHVFRSDAAEPLSLEIGLTLWTRDKVDYLEVIKNGQVEHEVRLDQLSRSGGRLPPLLFHESGWFLIRAVTNRPETYRFASTGPYYVEIGAKRRISRRSVHFFLDWIDERVKQLDLEEHPGRDAQRDEYLTARHYWQNLLSQANAD